MVAKTSESLATLYESDETAWLDAMADLVGTRRLGEMDLVHLQEYLTDMARRDRREVSSRLAILIAHVLKWLYQPNNRSASWRSTIVVQRQELAFLLESGTLRNHAEATLAIAFENAIEQVTAETGLSRNAFPAECAWSVEQLLSAELISQ